MSAVLRPPLSLLLLLAACAVPLSGYPGGAPAEACLYGMVPNHTGTSSKDVSTMPFSVTRQTTADGVKVTIKHLQENYFFRGFLLMAREPQGTSWAKDKGSWQQVRNVNLLNECSAITHADRSEKDSVTVTWRGDPNVDIYATIVHDRATYWAAFPVQEGAPPAQQQQLPSAALQHAVITNRPFARPEFAPIVDQSRNVQQFFRQQGFKK